MTDFLFIAKSYKCQYEIEKEKFLYQVGQWTSIRMILLEVYKIYTKDKKCEEIEKLPSEEKKRLWKMAWQYRRDGVEDQEYLMELCRALYALEIYLKLNK
jgi:hypothetical protein